jgi:acetylornithine deacetylase
MEEPYLVAPGLSINADAAIVQLLHQACEPIRGKTTIRGVRYGTDAPFYAAANVPTIVFGPGNILQAHAAVEFVDLDEVQAAKEIFKRMVGA